VRFIILFVIDNGRSHVRLTNMASVQHLDAVTVNILMVNF